MTDFWNEFNRKHNAHVLYLKDAPRELQKKEVKQRGKIYHYGKNTQEKKTKKKKKTRRAYAVKRYPVFKVSD